jgi:hypothetical protein
VIVERQLGLAELLLIDQDIFRRESHRVLLNPGAL